MLFLSRVLDDVGSLGPLGPQQPEGSLFLPLFFQALPVKLQGSYPPEIPRLCPVQPSPCQGEWRNNETAAYGKEIQERKKKQVLFKPQTLG